VVHLGKSPIAGGIFLHGRMDISLELTGLLRRLWSISLGKRDLKQSLTVKEARAAYLRWIRIKLIQGAVPQWNFPRPDAIIFIIAQPLVHDGMAIVIPKHIFIIRRYKPLLTC
jgi:hypothetical protein